jgi:hypothetical protein
VNNWLDAVGLRIEREKGEIAEPSRVLPHKERNLCHRMSLVCAELHLSQPSSTAALPRVPHVCQQHEACNGTYDRPYLAMLPIKVQRFLDNLSFKAS